MADLGGNLTTIGNLVLATGGLGTAAMGLVDASKAFWGGPSNFGFGYIANALSPFLAALDKAAAGLNKDDILRTLKANWLNGVDKPDQKAKTKALIHLGLTQGSAERLAKAAGVDAGKLKSLAQKTAVGQQVTQDEINILGQFDTVLSAVLDAAYERADQKYRNGAKVLAMIVAVIMAVLADLFFFDQRTSFFAFFDANLGKAVLIGLAATPLAPVAKDLASSLQAAAAAVGTVKR
jgi:hypothetical protein